jgi:hypothetical protein
VTASVGARPPRRQRPPVPHSILDVDDGRIRPPPQRLVDQRRPHHRAGDGVAPASIASSPSVKPTPRWNSSGPSSSMTGGRRPRGETRASDARCPTPARPRRSASARSSRRRRARRAGPPGADGRRCSRRRCRSPPSSRPPPRPPTRRRRPSHRGGARAPRAGRTSGSSRIRARRSRAGAEATSPRPRRAGPGRSGGGRWRRGPSVRVSMSSWTRSMRRGRIARGTRRPFTTFETTSVGIP